MLPRGETLEELEILEVVLGLITIKPGWRTCAFKMILNINSREKTQWMSMKGANRKGALIWRCLHFHSITKCLILSFYYYQDKDSRCYDTGHLRSLNVKQSFKSFALWTLPWNIVGDCRRPSGFGFSWGTSIFSNYHEGAALQLKIALNLITTSSSAWICKSSPLGPCSFH